KIDVDMRDGPAGPLLRRWAKALGLSLVDRADLQGRLAEKVTLRKAGCSRLEAIEEVCRLLKLHATYTHERLTLHAGPRRWPVAFAGPFLVAVEEGKQFPPHGTGFVVGSFRAQGVPRTVAARQRERAQLTQATQEKGVSLRDDGGLYSTGSWVNAPEVIYDRQVVPLKNLWRDVRSVTLAGEVPLRLPGQVEKVRLKPDG